MKLLLVASGSFFSTYGGGQVYVKNLVDELLRQGVSPVIATPGRSTDLQEEKYKGCRVVKFPQSASEDDIHSILKKIKPTVVHAHGYKAVFAVTCSRLDIPCIITAHHGGILCPAGTLLNHKDEICRNRANLKDCLPCVLKNIRGGSAAEPLLRMLPFALQLRLGRVIKRLPFIFYLTPVIQAALGIQKKIAEWRTIYTKAALIIAPSTGIAQSMIQNGCPTDQIEVVPHGVPEPSKKSPESAQRLKKHHKDIQFFYVGRVSRSKGVHVMLEAFSALHGNAGLHIIGGVVGKNEQRYMEKLEKKYRNNQRIIWHGKVESNRIYEQIAQYDVMIHPAICLEVFGLNVAEALSLGKPVIATRCGGPEIQIQDGVNGWLVMPNDVGALEQALQKFVRGGEAIKNFRVIHSDKKPITIDKHVNKLIKVYEKNIN